MDRLIEDFFKEQFIEKGFLPDPDNHTYCEIGSTWKLSDKLGEGTFWFYGQQDLFDIKIHDFFFHEDTVMHFVWPECLDIMKYDSVSGEELAPYRRLEAGIVKSFIGGYKPYKVLIHKKIPVRSIGVGIMPAYYEGYLKGKYPGEYANPYEAFEAVDQTMNFPEMDRLLRQIMNYRGTGMAARLFYEGKVAEAVSLIVERNNAARKKQITGQKLSTDDIRQLENITLYINEHCLGNISLDQIIRVSCMSARKLQTAFKEYHGCTITEYIQQRRMSQAENLLANTDLPIGQIAQTVGYSKANYFAERFRKSTGFLPGKYRKMAQRK